MTSIPNPEGLPSQTLSHHPRRRKLPMEGNNLHRNSLASGPSSMEAPEPYRKPTGETDGKHRAVRARSKSHCTKCCHQPLDQVALRFGLSLRRPSFPHKHGQNPAASRKVPPSPSALCSNVLGVFFDFHRNEKDIRKYLRTLKVTSDGEAIFVAMLQDGAETIAQVPGFEIDMTLSRVFTNVKSADGYEMIFDTVAELIKQFTGRVPTWRHIDVEGGWAYVLADFDTA